MSIHIYARAKPMSDVVGRADYISSPDRQERLLAVAGITEKTYWKQLSDDSQAAWREAGGVRIKMVPRRNKETGETEMVEQKKPACEAREIHVALPQSIKEMSAAERKKVARRLHNFFSRKYGVGCLVGIHESKTDGNVHAHILFAERQRLAEPVIKIATRNIFLNEDGVRCRTKKEIMDDRGEVRQGCRIIPKGEIASEKRFGDKETTFAEKGWLKDVKQDLADWINEVLQPDQERVVYDPEGLYLAQIHVGKGRPDDQKKTIETWNKNVRKYNQAVREGLISGQQGQDLKTQIMLSPNRNGALVGALYLAYGTDPGMSITDMGGTRTAEGSNEAAKRQLRELYRLAQISRQAAAAATPGSSEQRQHRAEARQYSARIDRLRRELGYYRDEDYMRVIRRREDDLRRKRAWILKCRDQEAYWGNRVYGMKSRIKYLEKQLHELPIFFLSDAEKREKLRLEQEIREARIKLEECEDKERHARVAKLLAKYELKEIKKQLKAEKKAAGVHGSRSRPKPRSNPQK